MTVGMPTNNRIAQGNLIVVSERKNGHPFRYREVGSYRGAAAARHWKTIRP